MSATHGVPGVKARAHSAQVKSKSYLLNEVAQLNFYRVHMGIFVLVTIVASVIIYGEGLANDSDQVNGERLQYIDALFLACSAITTTGLNTVNMSNMTGFQQAVLCVLMTLGSIPFSSTFVVVVRRHYFRKKLAHLVENSKSAQRILQDLDQEQGHRGSDSSKSTGGSSRSPLSRQSAHLTTQHPHDPRVQDSAFVTRRRRSTRQPSHLAGYGGFPTPWEVMGPVWNRYRWDQPDLNDQKHPYVSFKPSFDKRGRFRALTENERHELGGVEYRALHTLVWVLTCYTLFWIALGTAFLVSYSYYPPVAEIVRTSQPGNLSPGWWAFFSVTTSYSNCGLNLLNENFAAFQSYYLILIVAGGLTWSGNTQFPVFLRFAVWLLAKIFPKGSKRHDSFTFLLHHPRRCFIYLFPARETWILFGVQVGFDMLLWIAFEVLNIGLPVVDDLDVGVRTFDGLFQATGVRKSGAFVVTVSSLAPALLILYLIGMYIQNFPVVLTLRRTNLYEERSIGLDATDVGSTLGRHLQNQLAYDLWFMLLVWWLICIIERGQLNNLAPGFGVFELMFETVSAYGNVGLSTGVPYDNYSLSGQFHVLSKLVLMAAMLRGRHRGLPLAVDRSILLPGQDLMRQLDDEYNERGHLDKQKEAQLRREELRDDPESTKEPEHQHG